MGFSLSQKVFLTPILLLSLLKLEVNCEPSCSFLKDANRNYMRAKPVVEEIIPSFQHSLKFLNVDATVYRHVLRVGSFPKIKVLRYSSTPKIMVDTGNNEVLVSTEETDCIGTSASPGRRKGLLSVLVASFVTMALSTGHGYELGSRPTGATLLSSIFLVSMTDKITVANAECTPSMEVVIEAPPYYLGSVAECQAEVENPDHCPQDFPTYPTCSDYNPSCDLAVIGAGTGGLYAAMRLVDENKISGDKVCIFEATERVGGRLYSLRGFGPNNKITVDAGGYRTWPEYTPTTHALIEDYLGLKTGCYEDEDKIEGPCERFNIVDENGVKIGFATFVEEMMNRLVNKGACFFPRHELISIDNSDGTSTLNFANGAIAIAPQVILNIPQRPLLKILRKSNIPFAGDLEEEKIFDAAHSVQTEVVTKLYLYYDDAWWYRLKLFNGDFSMTGDAREMLLEGRYHDGHVECDGDGCHGFLLAVYAHDFGGNKAQYFRRYQRDRPEPVTVISNTDIEGAAFLKHAHSRLKEHHVYKAENASYTGFEATQVFDSTDEPSFAVLATWNIGTYGAGGGWHHWTELDNVEQATEPLNDYNIHVINEAFSKLQGWAEGSLLLADEVLQKYFSVQRPWSFDAPDFVQRVAQTSSQECPENDGSGGGGGSGSGGGGGNTGSGGGNDDILCFTQDALVEMADGTLLPISNVKKGDFIHTGFSNATGLVSEVLVHAVDKDVQVVIVPTPFGDLIGTPTHPVYINDQWMELEEALRYPDARSRLQGSIEIRPVDYFYNLEVDGDTPGLSSHSYVVNGVIASGLGDGHVLNEMFARQKVWK